MFYSLLDNHDEEMKIKYTINKVPVTYSHYLTRKIYLPSMNLDVK